MLYNYNNNRNNATDLRSAGMGRGSGGQTGGRFGGQTGRGAGRGAEGWTTIENQVTSHSKITTFDACKFYWEGKCTNPLTTTNGITICTRPNNIQCIHVNRKDIDTNPNVNICKWFVDDPYTRDTCENSFDMVECYKTCKCVRTLFGRCNNGYDCAKKHPADKRWMNTINKLIDCQDFINGIYCDPRRCWNNHPNECSYGLACPRLTEEPRCLKVHQNPNSNKPCVQEDLVICKPVYTAPKWIPRPIVVENQTRITSEKGLERKKAKERPKFVEEESDIYTNPVVEDYVIEEGSVIDHVVEVSVIKNIDDPVIKNVDQVSTDCRILTILENFERWSQDKRNILVKEYKNINLENINDSESGAIATLIGKIRKELMEKVPKLNLKHAVLLEKETLKKSSKSKREKNNLTKEYKNKKMFYDKQLGKLKQLAEFAKNKKIDDNLVVQFAQFAEVIDDELLILFEEFDKETDDSSLDDSEFESSKSPKPSTFDSDSDSDSDSGKGNRFWR